MLTPAVRVWLEGLNTCTFCGGGFVPAEATNTSAWVESDGAGAAAETVSVTSTDCVPFTASGALKFTSPE